MCRDRYQRTFAPLIPRSGLVQSWLCWAQHNQDYIQIWHGDANLLRESLEAVQQTAAVILGGITPEPVAMTAAA